MAYFARTVSLLNPQISSSLKVLTMASQILFQFLLKFSTALALKFFTLNLIFSQNRTRHVFKMKSSEILNPGLPMSKTSLTSLAKADRASEPSEVFQFAIVMDIKRFEKLRGVPPLFVRIKISRTASISCSSTR